MMQMAIDVIQTMLNSTRTNAIKQENRALAIMELKGTDENKKIGLEWRLERACEEAEFDFSDLDSLTVPTRRKFQFTDL